jgi:hypothetical protein
MERPVLGKEKLVVQTQAQAQHANANEILAKKKGKLPSASHFAVMGSCCGSGREGMMTPLDVFRGPNDPSVLFQVSRRMYLQELPELCRLHSITEDHTLQGLVRFARTMDSLYDSWKANGQCTEAVTLTPSGRKSTTYTIIMRE